jgi:glutamyl-tRNA reductase
MENFKIIAFTHKTVGLDCIGKMHLEGEEMVKRLAFIKEQAGLSELMYLSTCNRVEFLMITSKTIDKNFISIFFESFDSTWSDEDINWAANNAGIWAGEDALEHLLNVASSLDSMVVGEREIITQVRTAYDQCKEAGLTGDFIRLIIKHTIETAKRVYTETNVSRNPVSVVSLAYRKLKELNVKLEARFILIGSGITNTTMARYLKKHGFRNFTVFNRTLANAQKLAKELGTEARPLSEIQNHKEGFDVIVSCTGAAESIITKALYKSLIGNDHSRKIVIDLAVPNDLDPEVLNSFDVNLIAVNNLQDIAKSNLNEREKELSNCAKIIRENIAVFRQVLKTRKVELAMSEVPRKVKEIHHTALTEVFAKDFDKLDEHSKKVLGKILSYVEKKYISLPMKMAKEILIEK